MIRINKLIPKNKIFDLVINENVSKVELLSARNRTLKNEDLCRVNVYFKIDNIGDLNNSLGLISKISSIKTDWIKSKNKAFLTGCGSIPKTGFIRASTINRLKAIELEENVNFGFPSYFHEIIDKNK